MKNNILIIDDDPLYLTLLDNRLQKEYGIIKRENGKEAILYLENNEAPDLIIADLNMPVMNGYQFISYIKSNLNFSRIPLIVISGENMLMLKNRCYKAGANKFFVKPLDMNGLLFSIKELLEKQEVDNIYKKERII